MNEISLKTDSLTPEEALEHLKRVIDEASASASSATRKYTSTLLVCFCWKEDDVLGNLDCDEITHVFENVYHADSLRVILDLKSYSPREVLFLTQPVINKLKASDFPLVV
jgi:hypothetical protein